MPIYEYQCQECGFEHEALQKISDAPLTTCPSCGAEALEKLISAAGFRLSGKGWYETDFKSSNQKNLSQKDSTKPEKTESKKSDTKSDTKESSKKPSSASA
jgi:putative FmdB family regulatory protein